MSVMDSIPGVMDTVVAFRRELHQNAELSMQEFAATRRIMELLGKVPNLELTDLKPGVLAVLRGKHPGKALAIRADMDALNMVEESGLPFASKNHGACHACGHDMHAAMLLGCAMVLGPQADKLHGSITFMFQPGEETLQGAYHLLEHKVLDNPRIDAIFGLHCAPWDPVGTVSITPGVTMASADNIDITVHGRSCHAGYPHRGVDTVMVAAHIITAIQTMASRWCDPADALVVSLGVIKGGTARNILPDSVSMSGTVRTLSAAVRDRVPAQLEQIITHTAKAFGGTAELNYVKGSPPVNNDPVLADLAIRSAVSELGQERVLRQDKAVMGGEDFALYMEKVPGLFIRVGTVSDNPQTRTPAHNPRVRFDEGALPVGVRVLTRMALDYLDANKC